MLDSAVAFGDNKQLSVPEQQEPAGSYFKINYNLDAYLKAWVKTPVFFFQNHQSNKLSSWFGGGNWGRSALKTQFQFTWHLCVWGILPCVSTCPKHTNARWVGSEFGSHAMPRGKQISEAVTYPPCSHLCKYLYPQTQLRQGRNFYPTAIIGTRHVS